MYIGRFAPTPSGRLHFGSLIALLGGYLRAKSLEGKFLLRIEDLDTPRCSLEATSAILKDCQSLGFDFDGEVLLQHDQERLYRYAEVIESLKRQGQTYYCTCTRASRRLRTCLCSERNLPESPDAALYFKAPQPFLRQFYDELLGQQQDCACPAGCTLMRRDKIIAYNLACVVDDHDSGVTEVVRGSDLIDETPLQIAIFKALGWTAPHYLHLPLALQKEGLKFSKQNHALAVLDCFTPSEALLEALTFLGQNKQGLDNALSPREILNIACSRFEVQKIPKQAQTFNYPAMLSERLCTRNPQE